MTTLLTPAYRLTLGKHVADTTVEPKASATTDIVVTLDMDSLPDTLAVTLGQVGGIDAGLQDQAAVQLGYADDGGFTQVFVGLVDSLESGLLVRRMTAVSAVRALLRLFVNQTYEGQTAGSIVRDLAGRANLALGTIDDGITFPYYAVDQHRSALTYIRELAALCGVDLYVDSEGHLVFQAFTTGNTIHDIDYAKQILTLEIDRSADADVTVTAFGESPTASAGSDAWGWLTKDFSKSAGRAGNGPVPIILENSALRTNSAAATAASAGLRNVQRRAVRGQMVTPGRPEVKLGDAVRLRDVPFDGFNDEYQVRRVVHRMTKEQGFTTAIGFAAIPSEALS